MRRVLRNRWVRAGLVAAMVAVAFGLYWFEPWQLWVTQTVHEEAPAAVTAPATSDGAPPAGPRLLATGALISHEHATTGDVRILRLDDGSRVLRLEDLATSNGPDLHVWLSDAPVLAGADGWHVFDDGAYVSLGELKGNRGDQNYPLPDGVELDRYSSVTIWCDRFNVSFGAAQLQRA